MYLRVPNRTLFITSNTNTLSPVNFYPCYWKETPTNPPNLIDYMHLTNLVTVHLSGCLRKYFMCILLLSGPTCPRVFPCVFVCVDAEVQYVVLKSVHLSVSLSL